MSERQSRPRPQTVLDVLRAAQHFLAERGVDAPRLSVELLMARVLDLSRLQLYLAFDRPLDEAEREKLRPLVAARARGEPLAYLLGDWPFREESFLVTKDVLVPRPETEGLVDLVLERAPEQARCLELGTGSGVIAISMALEREDLQVDAVELSPVALRVAQANLRRFPLAGRVALFEGSWWQPVRESVAARGPYDLLVSNPPYVESEREDLLAPEVRAHEPAVALFSEPGDPLSAYRAILAGVEKGVARGGWVLFETGVEAAEGALELLRRAEFLEAEERLEDLAGLPRYLLARRCST